MRDRAVLRKLKSRFSEFSETSGTTASVARARLATTAHLPEHVA
jgi:hypothetical protein